MTIEWIRIELISISSKNKRMKSKAIETTQRQKHSFFLTRLFQVFLEVWMTFASPVNHLGVFCGFHCHWKSWADCQLDFGWFCFFGSSMHARSFGMTLTDVRLRDNVTLSKLLGNVCEFCVDRRANNFSQQTDSVGSTPIEQGHIFFFFIFHAYCLSHLCVANATSDTLSSRVHIG